MTCARNKKAVLTYHRVLDGSERTGSGGARSFYDVPVSEFKREVAQLAAHSRDYDGLELRPDVVITFDDGTEDHLRAAEILASAGLSAIFFIITGRLGTSGYLSHSVLPTLVRLGHQLGSHTVTHRRVTMLAPDALRDELHQSRDFLQQATGNKVEWFAPPGGYLNQPSLEAALACGYCFVRTMEWGYASTTQTGRIPCIPIFPGTTDRAFDKIINGTARLYGFRLKEAIKHVLGERGYVMLRNRLWMPSRHA
jgi:peptidoglycan/xylan/chitin deacetylase (PgdA/CDA1 family)